MTTTLEHRAATTVRSPRGALLELRDLVISARRNGGTPIVTGASVSVGQGEVLGIVGESGSGKSLTCLAVAGLLPRGTQLSGGSIQLEGRELAGLKEKALGKIRGKEIGFIFQDPVAALNPGLSVGSQVVEPIRRHLGLSRSESKARAIEWLDRVGIPGAARRYGAYPREFSGGMRQRVMIAMALSCNPKLVIADEPTTALDVTMQAQILDLIRQLQEETSLTMVLVTHDFGVARSISDRVAVFYAGQIVEEGSSEQICRHPQHPYTAGLLRSVPSLAAGRGIPVGMPGSPPSVGSRLAGCRFYSRCDVRSDDCQNGDVALVELPVDRVTRCRHPERLHDADPLSDHALAEPGRAPGWVGAPAVPVSLGVRS
jgi:oligopeptide/dipeptide ABC transporter ATP-binding protein